MQLDVAKLGQSVANHVREYLAAHAPSCVEKVDDAVWTECDDGDKLYIQVDFNQPMEVEENLDGPDLSDYEVRGLGIDIYPTG